MNMWNKSKWSFGVLVAAGAWVFIDALAAANRRRHAKKAIAREVQEWENEGGSPPPAATEQL